MKKDENKIVSYPLCVNFKTFIQYDISKINIDEIVFFEWLIVKRLSFGSDEFFYQNERVIKEIGIKRHRLEVIKNKFCLYGLIIELKGNNNTSHYLVNPEFIKCFVNEHLLNEYRANTLKQLLTLDFKNEIKVSKVTKNRIIKFIKTELEIVYNQRRKDNIVITEGKKFLTPSGLNHNKKTYQQFSLLMSRYSNHIIKNSFICFIDMVITGEDNCNHILNNFSSFNRAKDSFPIFENRLNTFNNQYAMNN